MFRHSFNIKTITFHSLMCHNLIVSSWFTDNLSHLLYFKELVTKNRFLSIIVTISSYMLNSSLAGSTLLLKKMFRFLEFNLFINCPLKRCLQPHLTHFLFDELIKLYSAYRYIKYFLIRVTYLCRLRIK